MKKKQIKKKSELKKKTKKQSSPRGGSNPGKMVSETVVFVTSLLF